MFELHVVEKASLCVFQIRSRQACLTSLFDSLREKTNERCFKLKVIEVNDRDIHVYEILRFFFFFFKPDKYSLEYKINLGIVSFQSSHFHLH
jgi:hypothetical protein